MGGKGVSLIHRLVNFPQGHFFGFPFQNRAAVRTPQRGDESGFLKFDQEPSNHDGVGIHRLRQTRRGTTIVLLQCQDRHHMHRKSKSAAGHAMNVTNLITFSKGYQSGFHFRLSNSPIVHRARARVLVRTCARVRPRVCYRAGLVSSAGADGCAATKAWKLAEESRGEDEDEDEHDNEHEHEHDGGGQPNTLFFTVLRRVLSSE